MDDQRCPLEEGQAGAAEATAAPTLEERAGKYRAWVGSTSQTQH